MDDYATDPVADFYRCPTWFSDCQLRVQLPEGLATAFRAARSEDPQWRSESQRWLTSGEMKAWIDLLRLEHYDQASTETTFGAILAREAYYLIRPLLGVSVRRHLQRLALRDWANRPFPSWPVDRSADFLMETFLAAATKIKQTRTAPFIWFWPDDYSACAMLTHDVETEEGLRFCPALMDMDDSAGIKSAFQLVPEQRYTVTASDLERFHARGFEVNVHDLNHDGHLFRDHENFRRRVVKINEYGRKFGAAGFRAGALYRNQDWYDALDFQYDMSVPNVAHLDPQHGGCCTLFPYFIGKLLELPVTAIQDYSLFHVLETYSINTWRTQMNYIAAHHGMINVITHPDYVIEQNARSAYLELLQFMNDFREEAHVWFAQPHEVNSWWRNRAQMRLVWKGDKWAIDGPDSGRATVAYFTVAEDGTVAYQSEKSRSA